MPRLQSVRVDCRRHFSEMRAFGEQFGEDLEKANELKLKLEIVRFEPMTFQLRGPAVKGVDIQFKCGS